MPTPGDLAARPRRPLTARPDVPSSQHRSVPAPGAPFRVRFEWTIRHSRLNHRTRLIALVAATWADYDTGEFPAGITPSVQTLATAAGLSRHSVLQGITDLTARHLMRRVERSGEPGIRIALRLPPDWPLIP